MTDPKKVESIVKFQPPTTLGGLQRFLGMVGWYRRFIKDFSTIAAPLHELLRANSKSKWQIHIPGTDQNKAFMKLKDKLITTNFKITKFQQTIHCYS